MHDKDTIMKRETFLLKQIPALLLGEASDKGFFFAHGQGGNKTETITFTEIALSKGWQVFSMDLPEYGGARMHKGSCFNMLCLS